jgi:hypothetical protein
VTVKIERCPHVPGDIINRNFLAPQPAVFVIKMVHLPLALVIMNMPS